MKARSAEVTERLGPGVPMARARPFVSPLSLTAAVVVAALTVGAFLGIRHSVGDQNQALLETQAEQVTQLLQTALSQEGTSLTAIAAVATATGASPTVFQAEAVPFTKAPGTTVALVRSGQVLVAVGHGFISGHPLPASLVAAVSHGGPQLSSTGVLTIDGQQVIALIVGGGPTGAAVVAESVIHPSATSASATGPYRHINIALYAASTARPDQLVVTTTRPLPLSGPVVDTLLPIGSSKWLVLTAAKAPLAGAWPNALPWILLGVGLLLAISLGGVVELLGRRERYATRMVAERTRELESSQHALVQRERLSAVGEMSTMIGHELRNPLAATINALFLARSRLVGHDDVDLARHLDLAERATSRAATLAEDLTTFMREREPEVALLDLREVIDEVLELAPPPPGTNVSVLEPGVAVEADRDLLIQMLTNLITNAYSAMPTGGEVRLAGFVNGSFTEITVQDSGPGIDPTNIERIFDPFFTTERVGTGLGLAIVKRLAEAHHGTVAIENTSPGARVTIRIPRSEITASK